MTAITPTSQTKFASDLRITALRSILSRIDEQGHRYAIIHHADMLESLVVSDVDIVIDGPPEGALEGILDQSARRGDFQVVQRLHYDRPFGYYYILAIPTMPVTFLHLDVVHDPWGTNRYLLDSAYLLENRSLLNGIWTVAPEKEAVYLTIKKVVKGKMSLETHARIRELISESSEKATRQFRRRFGPDGEKLMSELLLAEHTEFPGKELLRLRRKLNSPFGFPGLCLGMLGIFQEASRRLSRMTHPTGLFVAVLGPDGSGKSSLVEHVLTSLHRGYRFTWRFHWRPGLFRKLARQGDGIRAAAATAPPARYSYGPAVSLLRYLYYLADFVLGYWLVIYPKRVRTTLVIGERWYYDVLINPVRYGFRLPGWLLRLGGHLVPEPDLVVLLEADPAVVHLRKPELAVEEIRSQLEMMRPLLASVRRGVSIATDCPIAESQRALTLAILNATSGKNARAAGPDAEDAWIGFPLAKKPKLWRHGKDRPRHAFRLYHPYSVTGRLAKSLASVLPSFFLPGRRAAGATKRQLEDLATRIRQRLDNESLVISFSTGTPGPHRKITAQVSKEGRAIAYVKLGRGETIRRLLCREADALRSCALACFEGATLPEVLAHETDGDATLLYLSAPLQHGKARPTELDGQDVCFLEQLIGQGCWNIPVEEALHQAGFGARGQLTSEQDSNACLAGVVTDVCEAVTAILGSEGVRVALTHGDYAPWNTLSLPDGSLYVFDWEYSCERAPVIHDLLHRVFMPSMLVDKLDPKRSVRKLFDLYSDPLTANLIRKTYVSARQYPAYILLYLLAIAEKVPVGAGSYLEACMHHVLVETGHPNHRRRVLVSAYACKPDQGSEPGVGWNWALQIARYHDAWVVTRANNRESIEKRLHQEPVPHLHFIYADLPKWAGFWKKKQRGVRTYYYLWQIAAFFAACKQHRRLKFDLGHHVTFVNDWIWTFLAFMPIPYVWGPIGSHPGQPGWLLPTRKSRLLDAFKCNFQTAIRLIDPLYWVSAIRANQVLCINRDVAECTPLKWLARNKAMIEPAIGAEELPVTPKDRRHEGFSVLFVGRFVALKGPLIALDAFAVFAKKTPEARLTMIGSGPEEPKLKQRIASLGLAKRVEVVHWRPREQVLDEFAKHDIFLFPSMEGGGMVVLEAMSAGLPVVCLCFGGPGTMVTPETGILIEPAPVQQVVQGLAHALERLSNDATLRQSMGQAARQRVSSTFSWERKARVVRELYSRICGLYHNEEHQGPWG